uniref:Uncharacterized protein n=1 Tax=Erpetoichthys calabaricus TaxID=27687 RepID=A0A8C4XDR3_ERPCA
MRGLWVVVWPCNSRRNPSSPAVQPACGASKFKAASHPVSSETSLKFTNEVSLNGSFRLPQEDFDRSSANGVTEQSSVYLSNGARFQNIPFPATELGGAALVTTKTVQCTV